MYIYNSKYKNNINIYLHRFIIFFANMYANMFVSDKPLLAGAIKIQITHLQQFVQKFAEKS